MNKPAGTNQTPLEVTKSLSLFLMSNSQRKPMLTNASDW